MMISRTGPEDPASLFLDDTPLLDVRAPVEFARGAFPASTNLPLLDDHERHLVGIRYQRAGQQAAIDLGNELVSGEIREQRIQAWKRWCEHNPDGRLYCFRGGLRSRTVRDWLREAGVEITLVPGGYKALRRFLLDTLEWRFARDDFLVLCGRTGTAKTRVIRELEPGVDLEGLARHRGSAFGRRPGGQPSQIDFENGLAVELLKRENRGLSPVLLEDESRLIGRCHLPVALQARMKDAPRIVIEESLEARVEVTLEDYIRAPLDEYAAWYGPGNAARELGRNLLESMDRIRKRLGGARHRELRAVLENALDEQYRSGETAQHSEWIRPLLRDYYDPMYDYMMRNHRHGHVLFRGTREQVLEYLRNTRAGADRE